MAVSKETFCHHLLSRWQKRMQENVWNFNQLKDTSYSKTFKGVYIQEERELIAHALTEAFDIARYYLGYYPQPTYIENEVIYFHGVEYFEDEILDLDQRYLTGFGTRATSLIEADVSTATLSDEEEADSVDDTVTLSVSTSVTDTSEIQVFYRTDEGAPSAAHQQWRIPTESVTLSGGTATIKLHRANTALPSIWDTPYNDDDTRNEGDRTASGSYVSAVDVYRVYRDETSAVKILTEPSASNDYTVNETVVNPVVLDTFETRFRVKLSSGTALSSIPYGVEVSYQAGLPYVNGQMNQALEQAVIRLANSNLAFDHGPMSHRTANMWGKDWKELFTENVVFAQAQEYLNPLGTRRGHLEAWLVFKRMADKLKGMVA